MEDRRTPTFFSAPLPRCMPTFSNIGLPKKLKNMNLGAAPAA